MSDGHWRPYAVKWRVGGVKTGVKRSGKVMARDEDEAWEIMRLHEQSRHRGRRITKLEVTKATFYD